MMTDKGRAAPKDGPWYRRNRESLRLGMENLRVVVAEGTLGLREEAPYDAIVVTAAAPRAPDAPEATGHLGTQAGRSPCPSGTVPPQD